MQILYIQSLEEDPYKNTLFDDPIHVSSFYTKNIKPIPVEHLKDETIFNELKEINETIYLGALELRLEQMNYSSYVQIIENYLNSLYKEEYIHDFYTLKHGSEKGMRWHEMIGDSFIEDEFLITELWRCDPDDNEIIGYFVMDCLYPKRGCFQRIENLYQLDSELLKMDTKQKLRYMLLARRIDQKEFESRYDISFEQLEEWRKEEIGNYLDYIKENG